MLSVISSAVSNESSLLSSVSICKALQLLQKRGMARAYSDQYWKNPGPVIQMDPRDPWKLPLPIDKIKEGAIIYGMPWRRLDLHRMDPPRLIDLNASPEEIATAVAAKGTTKRPVTLAMKRVIQRRMEMKKRKANPELEKAARSLKEVIHIPDRLHMTTSEFLKQDNLRKLFQVTERYHIAKHVLQRDSLPRFTTNVRISYNGSGVYNGNIIVPSQALKEPTVSWDPVEGKYYTLAFVSPDDNILDHESQYLHWLVTNIPGNDFSNGKTIYSYVPPIPPSSSGYHRYVYVLLEHDSPIPISPRIDRIDYHARKFCLSSYMAQHNAIFSSLAFFQSFHDESVDKWLVGAGFEPIKLHATIKTDTDKKTLFIPTATSWCLEAFEG